jgi:hypothetical protein
VKYKIVSVEWVDAVVEAGWMKPGELDEAH